MRPVSSHMHLRYSEVPCERHLLRTAERLATKVDYAMVEQSGVDNFNLVILERLREIDKRGKKQIQVTYESYAAGKKKT